MGAYARPIQLNLGCGRVHEPKPWTNVDAYDNCNPDVVHDLNVVPYPWEDNSVDHIQIRHTLEHLENWWEAFLEMARILKPGGTLRVHVPDESSATALCYRDHVKVFNIASFHGIVGSSSGTNAWATTVEGSVPLEIIQYNKVPYKKYEWMTWACPWLLRFCANHLRNFIWEQQIVFRKVGAK